jgi:hypothetical protein
MEFVSYISVLLIELDFLIHPVTRAHREFFTGGGGGVGVTLRLYVICV